MPNCRRPRTPWSGPSAKLGPYAASRRVDVRGLGVAAHEAVSGWPKARPCGPPNFSGTSMCGCVWLAVVRRFLYSSCNAEREFGKPRTTPHRGFSVYAGSSSERTADAWWPPLLRRTAAPLHSPRSSELICRRGYVTGRVT